jgi:D-lactate dehydrogenase (cytochrome)
MIIKTSQDEIQNYLVDASNYKGNCSGVYIPENIEEISQILFEADAEKTCVTISGNGTGLAGGRVPHEGIVISTEKLNRIIEINKNEMYAIVEPGVLLSGFQTIIKEYGLLYPPDPTERNCFIGATAATNASGEKTFKYGATRDYILALDIILPNGDLLKLERGKQKADGHNLSLPSESDKDYRIELPDYKMPDTKNASGYFCKKNMDAIDLFIGSEGTLGVIAKIKLKLVPLPEKIISCVIFFEDELDALSFTERAKKISIENRINKANNSLDALALEFLDENSLKFLQHEYKQIPANSKAAVWFEQEVTSGNEDFLLEGWLKLIAEHKGNEETAWFALNEKDKKEIEEFRHALSWKVNEYISKNNFRKLGTDVAVPDNDFREFYFFSKKIVEENRLNYLVYGHFGNSHMHLNMLPRSEEEYKTGKNVYNIICQKAVQLGGTVSAEHGIGKLKTEHLLNMYGKETIEKMKSIKKIFDPNFILGRGNIFKY